MRQRLLFIFFLILVLVSCQGGEAEMAVMPTPSQLPPTEVLEPTLVPPSATAPQPTEEAAAFAELEHALQAVVDAQVEAGFPGSILMVDAPDMNFAWQGAAGMADKAAEIPLESQTPFRLGGISSMMTAAVVLRLVEEGMIGLDDSISLYLDEQITDQLNGQDGEPYGDVITVRQLLNHTSGVASYFYVEDRNANGTADFEDIFVTDPDKIWEPLEAVVYTTGNMDPEFAPGESWSYSETNYILLGLIIEAVTGENLDVAYEKLLFEPLGMSNTFLAKNGDPRLDNIAHIYYDGLDVTAYPSLSWQWGGNGIVSTVEDLNHFMWALVNDQLFNEADTSDAMTEWTSMAVIGLDGLSYGLGIIDIDFGEFGMPEIGEIQGHNSMWNGFIYYWPQYNIVFTGTLNESLPMDGYNQLAMPTMQTLLQYIPVE